MIEDNNEDTCEETDVLTGLNRIEKMKPINKPFNNKIYQDLCQDETKEHAAIKCTPPTKQAANRAK